MSDEPVTIVQPHAEVLHMVVRCARLDEDLTRQLRREVAAAAEQARHLPVVLDLTNVDFIPSHALGVLVKFLAEFKNHGQRFLLVGLQRSVRSTLAVTRLDRLFEIFDTLDEAVANLHGGRPA